MGIRPQTIDHVLSGARRLATDRRRLLGGGALTLAGLGVVGGLPARAQDATPEVDLDEATPDDAAAASPADGVGGSSPDIDPQMQEVLTRLSELNEIPIESQPPFNARQLPLPDAAVRSLLSERGEPAQEQVAGVEHVLIPTPNGDLIARVYTPEGPAPFPVLVYFHGGGWVIADLDTYDASCRALTNAAGCVVVSVAYRQAPENPFPAAADDAYFSFQYVAENATLFGGDPARVAIGGESAGGNLSTVVCLLARDQGGILPVHQLLVYPVTTFVPEGEGADTIEQYGTSPPLTAGLLTYFGDLYVPDVAARQDPSASPLLAADLSGLPPATIIAAEIDVLTGQGRQYADALEAAGNDVVYSLYEGVTHEFFGTGAVVDLAGDAVAEAAARLQASFDAAAATPTA